MSVSRYSHAVLFALVLLLGSATLPASAALPTPNQPILLVQNSASSDRYQNFVPELLTTEGLNGFQTAQLPELTAAFLTNYDVVILPHLTLTNSQATLFQNYVNAGGTLVGFRPDLKLANVFGVASLGSTLSEGWLQIDTGTTYSSGLDDTVMKFHGTADLYSLSGASALATLYNSPGLPTSSPAASIYTFGLGKAVLFSFDLTQSIVLMRQGNPAWAGYPNNHDGFNTLRASQMFMDQSSGQFWNDLGDNALNDVPQADIQMRLFSNAVVVSNAGKRPLPRFWYFPNQNRALLLLTGDHHGDSASNSSSEINTIASYGGKFSEFLWYPFGAVSNSQVNTWLSAGHAMGIHFDDTAQTDSSGVGGSAASWNGMQNVLNAAISSFHSNYPSAPAPATTRNHFLIWVSRNASGNPDQTAQAKLFQAAGIELDVTYTAFPNRWGYMTGSGLPMKFLDTATGSVISVYEQATQFEDDVQLSGSGYSTNWNFSTAQSHYEQALSESLNKYNTVVTMLFHPDSWGNYQDYAQTALQYAESHSIPMMSASTWLQFWKARTASTVTKPAFSSNTLSFTTTASTSGLTLLVPNASGGGLVSTFRVNGVPQTFAVDSYQGVVYASVNLNAGTHSISVTYSAGGSILGQISPSSAAGGTNIEIQGGSINLSLSPAADGTYASDPLPADTYTVTPTAAGFTFSPASRSVTVGSTDVTGINFSATGGVTGQTLFTTQTPAGTNASDGPGVNYELGTAFTSTSAGQITGVRFWKGSSETGTHTGRIWSATGSLLASVTFTNETASGWQQQALATPLSIAANTTYVVSVNTGNTFYVFTNNGLSSQISNGSLRSVVGNNGRFGSPGTLPNSSFQASNYFRDVLFVSGTTYTISGTISPAASGSGATVTLSGAAGGTTTADANGNYSFTGLTNGNYAVAPNKAGFTFNPVSTAVTVNDANANANANFTATAVPTFSISGTISPAASGSGATVTLSGAASANTTADASGNYSFTGLANGSYTVTPSKSGFSFAPANAPVTVSNANVTGVNFTASVSTGTTGITIDATVFGDRSSNGSSVTTSAFSTSAGNELLLALVSADVSTPSGTNNTVTSVTGGGLTWALVQRTNTQRGTAEIWRAFAAAPLSNVTVTANLAISAFSSISVMSFQGVNTSGTNGSGAIGATGTGNAASGAPTASLTTTGNGSLVLGVGFDWDGNTPRTLGPNQTMIHELTVVNIGSFWMQRRSATTPNAGTLVTINDTAPANHRYNLSIVEVLAAP